MLKKLYRLLSENDFLLIILLFLGTLSWSLTMIKSGWYIGPLSGHGLFGIGFWGANGHDGVWHIALANSLSRGSFQMPTFAGENLKNYHLGFDLLLAGLSKISKDSTTDLYFRILPPIFAFLIGVLTYLFVKVWKKSNVAALWSVFFVYFAGSFGWLVTLFRDKQLGGESLFWSQQSISTLINPPFALSLIVMLFGLTILVKNKEKLSFLKIILLIVVFGILIQIKAYAGFLSLGGLLLISVWQLVRQKRGEYLIVFIGSLIVSLVLFLPLNRNSGNLIVFQPFWFLETMMGLSDRIGWNKFYEAMLAYKSGNMYPKFIAAYSVAFIIFIIGNFGTRLFAKFWKVKEGISSLKNNDYIALFLVAIIIAGIAAPTFFLQQGTPWNTIQFLYYSLFFSSILAGVGVWDLLKNKNITFKVIVSTFIIVFTLPTTLITLSNDYLPSRPPAKITNPELAALKFLSKQQDGVVLTYLYDEAKAKEAVSNPPRSLYNYESTAYVSAFANKPVYLEDEVNLNIMGYNWRQRRLKVEDFFATSDTQLAKQFIVDNKIKYLYLVKSLSPNPGELLKVGSEQLGIENVFDNNEISIFRVN